MKYLYIIIFVIFIISCYKSKIEKGYQVGTLITKKSFKDFDQIYFTKDGFLGLVNEEKDWDYIKTYLILVNNDGEILDNTIFYSNYIDSISNDTIYARGISDKLKRKKNNYDSVFFKKHLKYKKINKTSIRIRNKFLKDVVFNNDTLILNCLISEDEFYGFRYPNNTKNGPLQKKEILVNINKIYIDKSENILIIKYVKDNKYIIDEITVKDEDIIDNIYNYYFLYKTSIF
ncbi:hypothetical protein OO013_07985 [Mangrovivirga sp. M17]|uniref:Lipoprotein n=1 Tax=Mangrovivirga halotolerans TaxID=2993936 RepID=A0ABT3RRI5_9BACT|nr:hypothetical protein [Mangrovivirga halotolerans]MCX2743800.1 hypothetical protein [Mangrovivirga halotolerans]